MAQLIKKSTKTIYTVELSDIEIDTIKRAVLFADRNKNETLIGCDLTQLHYDLMLVKEK